MVSKSTEIILSIIAYSICSGTLVLLNKLVLYYIGPYPSVIVSFQLFVTLIFILICKITKRLQVDDIQWIYVKPYLLYTIAFSLGVYCNMKSLSYSNVETVIVFRSISPCVVSILDYIFLGRELPSTKSWIALFTIVFGAYCYAYNDKQFQSQGIYTYIWPFLYLIIISFEMAYGKRIIKSVDLKTQSGPVLYTNMLGIWPFFIFGYIGDEYNKLYNHIIIEEHYLTTYPIILLILSCIIGIGIGYSSWWCRDQISATSFTLIGVMNKCITVLINLMIWDQHASYLGIVSLFICLVGGMIYEQAPMRKDNIKDAKQYVLTIDNGITSDNNDNNIWNDHDMTEMQSNDEHELLLRTSNSNSSLYRDSPAVTRSIVNKST